MNTSFKPLLFIGFSSCSDAYLRKENWQVLPCDMNHQVKTFSALQVVSIRLIDFSEFPPPLTGIERLEALITGLQIKCLALLPDIAQHALKELFDFPSSHSCSQLRWRKLC